jgi:O-antigen/teichoic acid export membrane protein
LIKEPSDFLLVPLINLFIAAVNLSFVLFFVSKKEKLHFKYLGITKSYLMIFESSKYFFSTIMPYALMSIFAVYISHNLNATDLGIFTLLMQLMSVINSFAQMTAIVYMKHASSSLKKLKKTLLYCFAFGICFALAMLIFGDLVIELFFTGEITNFRSALDILSLLIPILFINRVLFQCFILLNINVRSSLISFLVPILISSLMTLFARLELDLISAALMYSVFRLLEFTTLIVQTIFLRSENRFSTKSSILPENKEKK